MNDLMLRVVQGQATPKEVDRLAEWRSSHIANEREYQAARALWELTGKIAPKNGASPVTDHHELIRRAEGLYEPPALEQARFAPTGSSDTSPGRWLGTTSAPKVAAIAALIVVGIGAGLLGGRPLIRSTPLAEGIIATGSGEMTTVTLADGSSVRIGPQTTLRLAADRRGQIVDLDGRAFFGVRADASREFRVRTAHGEAVVFGTRFEVRSDVEEFSVLVVDGEVEVSVPGSEAARLRGGEMGLSLTGEPLQSSRVNDVFARLDWMGNTLVFQGTRLDQAALEIERRYGIRVTIDDPELADVEVTMTFTDRPADEVLLVLCEVVGALCVVEPDEVRIGRTTVADGMP